MKVGCINYATDQGLGYLMKDFYDNGVITDVAIVPQHSSRPTHYDWYPNPFICNNSPNPSQRIRDEFILGLDVLLLFETSFFPWVVETAKHAQVPIVLVPMYECTPRKDIEAVDVIINPSALDQQYFPQGTHLTIPVPNHIKYRERKRARVFVHNAGHGGLRGRNGTQVLLQSMKYVESPIELIVRSQSTISLKARGPVDPECHQHWNDSRIKIKIGTYPREKLFEEGDVFIFPDSFNGLSLPLQEAYVSGMLVMATNRYPHTEWLPNYPLIPVSKITKERICSELLVDVSHLNPRIVAKMIDDWYDKDISSYSDQGREWGAKNSWTMKKSEWMSALANVVLQYQAQ